MINLDTLRFSSTHEWVRVERKKVIVGITDFQQRRLSDVISIELPEPDDHHFEKGEEIGVLESVSTSADFHAPISGKIVAVNTRLLSQPELINSSPYGDGWLIEMKPDSLADVSELMNADEYEDALPEDEQAESDALES
jgi:glycine cleavage system H protein